MPKASAEENVDRPHCTCKELWSSHIAPVLWPQLLLVQSARQPMP
jgi:hypothetical protein